MRENASLFERARTDDRIITAWSRPERTTEAAGRALYSDDELVHLMALVAAYVVFENADAEGIEFREGEIHEIPQAERPTKPGKPLFALQGLWLQMSFSKAVDNFLAYLSELVALLYTTRPESLQAEVQSRTSGSEPSVPISVVLEHDSIDSLIAAIVERRVTKLSFLGIPALTSYLERRLGFSLFQNETDRAETIRIVERRNVIVHNRAEVNRTYVERVSTASAELIGHKLSLDPESVFRDLRFLRHLVLDIDSRAAEKWALSASQPVYYDPFGQAAI